MARKKGKKNNSEIGTPIKILFAKVIDFSKSLCSTYEKKIVIILAKGSDTKNPAIIGFLKESQLAKEMSIAERITFMRNSNYLSKKIFDF